MALVTKQQALRQIKCRSEEVYFEELGGEIRFVELTEAEYRELAEDPKDRYLRLILACAHGEGGRLFADTDINKLVLWPEHMIEKAARVVMRLHGKLPDEDAEKNSGSAPPSTVSPPASA